MSPSRLVTSVFFVALCACSRADTDKPHPASESNTLHAEPLAGKVRVVHATRGEVGALVKDELARAKNDHRQVLVYIGATWCEPCQRFHHAVEQGKLDKQFPDLTLVEFDLDADGQRLEVAGYAPGLIPYFGVPGADGHATGKGISGSIKGDGAVEDIVPRLKELLAGS
jgi:thiol-disulfide isomerase/thioredoxin